MANRNNGVSFTSDEVRSGPFKNACCVDVNRVYDSCCDKDCLEDLTVVFTAEGQELIDNASTVRARNSEILTTYIDVDEIPYNRGCYAVEINYYFVTDFDVYPTTTATVPETVRGICNFRKNCLLYGSEGRVRVFTNEYKNIDSFDTEMPVSQREPVAKVQAVDPMILDSRTVPATVPADVIQIPAAIEEYIGAPLVQNEGDIRVLLTLGLFSIIQLERSVQVMIPVYDFCVPEKECSCDVESPCDMFRSVEFPMNEFFPSGSARCSNCGCEAREENA